MKKITIKIEFQPAHTRLVPGDGPLIDRINVADRYFVVSMTNAGDVNPQWSHNDSHRIRVGSEIPAGRLDEFCRDRRWDTIINKARV